MKKVRLQMTHDGGKTWSLPTATDTSDAKDKLNCRLAIHAPSMYDFLKLIDSDDALRAEMTDGELALLSTILYNIERP
jgi:hypothetical protein